MERNYIMPREIVFGNQSMLVGIDANYLIRDIYYPHIGMENHLNGHKNRMGIWIDGIFSWFDNPNWVKEIKYEPETLVGASIIKNRELSLRIIISDAVHHQKNVFLRQLSIENLYDKERTVRLYFSNDLQILEDDIGITAYYDPKTNSIIHYLKNRYFLFNGSNSKNEGISSFATGKAHFGKEGTYKDAEDGILSRNPVDQGAVDSTIEISLIIPPKSIEKAYYWFSAGKSYEEVQNLNFWVKEKGISNILDKIRIYDKIWVNKNDLKFLDLSENIVKQFKRSLLIVKTQIDHDGAIIAANDSDILQFNRDHYSYMWPRDGALVAYALDKAGYTVLTQNFFQFCADVITPEGYLLHKYNPDKTPGSSWHPWYNENEGEILAIQEDETALVLFALWHHYEKNRDLDFIAKIFNKLVIPAADFLVKFRDKNGLPLPSYDLWEERRGILTFTTSSVYAGLKAAANLSHLFGEEKLEQKYHEAAIEIKKAMTEFLYDKKEKRFLRMINFDSKGEIEKDYVIDASLYAIFEFGVFEANDPLVKSTIEQVTDKLWIKTEVGGVARYQNDYYHQISQDLEKVPGNPWFICTLWLSEYYISLAKMSSPTEYDEYLKKATELLEWVSDRALTSGILAEQVHPYSNKPLSVSPLTWSHATFILTVIEYLEAFSHLKTCSSCKQPLHFHKTP
jgi:oligosaccharide amylase